MKASSSSCSLLSRRPLLRGGSSFFQKTRSLRLVVPKTTHLRDASTWYSPSTVCACQFQSSWATTSESSPYTFGSDTVRRDSSLIQVRAQQRQRLFHTTHRSNHSLSTSRNHHQHQHHHSSRQERKFTNRNSNNTSSILEAQVIKKVPSSSTAVKKQQEEHERLERILAEALTRYEHVARLVDPDHNMGDDSSFQQQQQQREQALLQVRNAYEDLEYWDEALRIEELWMEEFCMNRKDDHGRNMNINHNLDRAAGLYRQGKLHMRLQETSKASQLYQEALDLYREEYGGGGGGGDMGVFCGSPEIGNILISMAGVHYHRGNLEESMNLLVSAETHFVYYGNDDSPSDYEEAEEVAEWQERKDVDDEDHEYYHPDFVKCLQHQGLLHRSLGNFRRALEMYRRALQVFETIQSSCRDRCGGKKKVHKHPPICVDDETSHSKRQALQLDIADMLAALDHLTEAIELYETILREDKEFHRLFNHDQLEEVEEDQASISNSSSNVALEGIVRHNMGKLRVQLGDHEAAVRDLTLAIELKTAATGDPHHPEIAKTWNSLGTSYAVLGDRSKALECFKQSLLLCRMHHDEDDPEVMLALRNIAVLKGERVPKWGT